MPDPTAPGVGEILRRFEPFLRRDRTRLVSAAVMLVLSALADTATIWMFKLLTDGALETGDLDAFWAPAAAWFAIAVVGGAASFLGAYLSSQVAERFLCGCGRTSSTTCNGCPRLLRPAQDR